MSACLLLGAMSGCAVGPDYRRPDAPDSSGYTTEPLSDMVGTKAHGPAAQTLIPNKDISGQWWALFRSDALDGLITLAFRNNPDVAAAQASLRQANENLLAQDGAYYPTVSASLQAERQKLSPAQFGGGFGAPGPFSLYGASVNVSYSLDIWGQQSRRIEALAAQAEYQRFQIEAAYLTLTGNVVTATIHMAQLQAQIAATQEIIVSDTKQYDILAKQFELGGASKADVLAQKVILAQAQATLPPLQGQLALQRNLISALVGRLPDQDRGEVVDLATLQLPKELPLTLPSQLLQQRPDVRAADAQLHYACATIGVATANMLPQISLGGAYGSEALSVHKLFSPGTAMWDLIGSLTQPIFEGGTLLHERRAAVAACDIAAAKYRSVVVQACRNVADALRSLQFDASTLAAQVTAEHDAADSLAISRERYKAGAIPILQVLDAERAYQQSRIAMVSAQAARFSDTAALFLALGGGWWNRSDVADDRHHDGR